MELKQLIYNIEPKWAFDVFAWGWQICAFIFPQKKKGKCALSKTISEIYVFKVPQPSISWELFFIFLFNSTLQMTSIKAKVLVKCLAVVRDISVLLKSKLVPNIPLLLYRSLLFIHPYRLMFPPVGLRCLWVNTTEIENCCTSTKLYYPILPAS